MQNNLIYRSTILSLFLVLVTGTLTAQKIKYKDLYPQIAERKYNDDILLTKLKEYKRQEPEEGNQYYQMGKLYYRRIDKFDVLKQLNGALQVADSGLHYFKTAKQVIDEKEVKRKSDYYLDFLTTPQGTSREKVTIEDVYSDIDYMVKVLEDYKANIKTIHTYFNLAVDSYTAANNLFTEIYGEYDTYKEMCLLADDAFLAKASEMNKYFDVAIENMNQYQLAIKKYPIEGYNQQYTLILIQNYRLHGLTKSNFLNNEISLWDYGTWYDELVHYIENEIKPLRTIIDQDERVLNEKLVQMSSASVPDESDYRIESDVLLLIKKYDPASFLVDIFKYKESKINLINSQILPLDSTAFENRVRQYSNTIIHGRASMRALNRAEKDLSPHLVDRHSAFFEKHYNNNLKQYIDSEQGFVKPILDNAIQSLRSDLLTTDEAIDTILYAINLTSNDQIPLTKTKPSYEGSFIVLDYYNNRGKRHITGYKIEERERKSFIAYTENDTLRWVTYPKMEAGTSSEAASVITIGNGCAVLIYAYQGDNRMAGINLLAEYTEKGKELLQHTLAITEYPADLTYNEDEGRFFAAFEELNNTDAIRKVSVKTFSDEGQINWSHDFMYSGQIASISNFDQGYLLAVNANNIQESGGTKYNAPSGMTNPYLAHFTTGGALKSSYFSKNDQSHFLTNIFNTDDQQINILGFLGNPKQQITNNDLLLIWLDEDLEVVDHTLNN